MFTSKEISLIICLSVLHFVMTLSIGQVAITITGIPGISYTFTILHAIITSFSLLSYQGKRWRFFVQTVLYTFLIIPTSIGGVSFDLLSKSNLIVNAFIADILWNSLFGFFEKRKIINIWAVISSTMFWMLNPIFGIIIKSAIMYPPEYITQFVNTLSIVYPVILVEGVVGGYIGQVIHNRVSREVILKKSSLGVRD